MSGLRPAARIPAELHDLWKKAMHAQDLDGLVALYEPDAVLFLDPEGPALVGRDAIREALAPHVEAGARVENATVTVLEGGDLAYLRSSWRFSTYSADGEPQTRAGDGAEVARRQPDGTWLLVLDHSYGAG